jgi:ATP-binding cassette subfamily B protein
VKAPGLLQRIWNDLAPRQRKLIGWSVLAMAGASALTAIFPVVAGQLVDRAVGRGATISFGGSAVQLGLIVALVFAQQALTVARRQLVENAATAFERDQRVAAYDKLVHLDLRDAEDDQVGALVGGGNRAIEGVVKLLKLAGMDLVPALLLAACAIVVAFTRNPTVAAVMLGVLPTGLGLVYAQVRQQRGVRVEIRDTKGDIDGGMTELLHSMDAVRATGSEGFFIDRVRRVCDFLRTREYAHHKAMARWDAVKAVNEGIWLCAVLATALILAAHHQVTVGDVTSYILLYASVLNPVRELHRILDEWSESTTAAEQHYSLLDQPDDIAYATAEPSAQVDGGRLGLAIKTVNLSFYYDKDKPPALSNVSVEIRQGERVGIVGETGCGKSTLLRLLARLNHHEIGHVEVAGQNLHTLVRDQLAEVVGYVPQKPKLFRGTIAENILLGDPSLTEDDMVWAAKMANIHNFVLSLEQGYQTRVFESGRNLSGGQEQRLCLARALVRRPRILLLDEPTAALDARSERSVTDAIDGLTGVTVVCVAHRLDTLISTDRILVMDTGQVVEEGTFEYLAEAGGPFAQLLRRESNKRAHDGPDELAA